MWNVAHSRRAASIQATVRVEHVLAVVVEAQDEAAVDLDTVVVQHRHPPRIIGRARGLLARLGQILVGQRLEADEDARAACQRHVADQRRIVGHVNRHGGAPDHPQGPKGEAKLRADTRGGSRGCCR